MASSAPTRSPAPAFKRRVFVVTDLGPDELKGEFNCCGALRDFEDNFVLSRNDEDAEFIIFDLSHPSKGWANALALDYIERLRIEDGHDQRLAIHRPDGYNAQALLAVAMIGCSQSGFGRGWKAAMSDGNGDFLSRFERIEKQLEKLGEIVHELVEHADSGNQRFARLEGIVRENNDRSGKLVGAIRDLIDRIPRKICVKRHSSARRARAIILR